MINAFVHALAVSIPLKAQGLLWLAVVSGWLLLLLLSRGERLDDVGLPQIALSTCVASVLAVVFLSLL